MLVAAPQPPALAFVQVSGGKTGKNRVHIDVTPTDRSQQEEVGRLEAPSGSPPRRPACSP